MRKSAQELLKEAEEARSRKLAEIDADPFIGFDTMESAFEAYKCNPQAEVLARLLNGENVFISGPAGSGKSFVLNRFAAILDGQFRGAFNIAVTASTGIAATLIGGQTIHSWAGLGIDTEPFDSKKVSRPMASKVEQMRTTDVLVIDEISMLPAYLFTKLDAAMKWARKSPKPFGGVQLILTGDFLQLPPVSKGDPGVDTRFAIQTDAWKEADVVYTYMDRTHRASDPRLKYILTMISNGKARNNPKVEGLIRGRIGRRADLCDPEKAYSTLFTVNRNVDEYNQAELAKNPNQLIKSRIQRTEGSGADQDKIIKQYSIPEEVEFKVGATVMVTGNIRQGNGDFIANGSIGTVSGNLKGVPMVKFNDGQMAIIHHQEYPLMVKTQIQDPLTKKTSTVEVKVAAVAQLPLKLGYAITVHKSQGQTYSGVVTDLSKVFTAGLGYVALSRVRSLDDLVITDWNPKALDLDPLSKKISLFVKKKALKSRESFLENPGNYSALLTEKISRATMWIEELSAKSNGMKRNWEF